MDWNWFFSSTAQSAAAIVGLFGAFVITKVIGNQSSFNKKNNLLDSHISLAKSLEDEVHTRKFNWYNKKIIEEELKNVKEKEFSKEAADFDPLICYKEYDFPVFSAKDQVLSVLRKEHEKYLEEKKEGTRLPSIPFSFEVVSFIRQQIDKEHDLISNVVIKVKQHCRTIEYFVSENKDNPESSRLVTICLFLTLALFYVGVIYPLSFLPLRADAVLQLSLPAFWTILFSIKGAILFSVSVVFNVIIIVFYVANKNLKYDGVKIDVLKEYSSISRYSEYLRNMEENMAESSSQT